MEVMGVIKKVDVPTEWCSPTIVVPKSNGKVRICGKAILHENHPMHAREQILRKLAVMKVISKLDANCGFGQQKLKDSSKPFATVITPWGDTAMHIVHLGFPQLWSTFKKACK